jgi:hypothetical protein
MQTKTLAELRAEFEKMAIEKMYMLGREVCGVYDSPVTQQFWCGYWQCAKKYGVIVGKDANVQNMNKWEE